jgi:hypothetical protein
VKPRKTARSGPHIQRWNAESSLRFQKMGLSFLTVAPTAQKKRPTLVERWVFERSHALNVGLGHCFQTRSPGEGTRLQRSRMNAVAGRAAHRESDGAISLGQRTRTGPPISVRAFTARLAPGNALFVRVIWLRREKETSMRHLAIVGAALAALGINLGNAEAASVRLEGLTTSGLPTIHVRYYSRYPSSYYRGRHPSYTSPHCYNRDEIRELQRMWPETNWPRSMRCFPYR